MISYRISWLSPRSFPLNGETVAEVHYEGDVLALDIIDDEAHLPENFYSFIPFPETIEDKTFATLRIGAQEFPLIFFRRW